MKTLSTLAALIMVTALSGAAWADPSGSWRDRFHSKASSQAQESYAQRSERRERQRAAHAARLSAALGTDMCDPLIGGTRGLFGMCLAYCKASELETSLADSGMDSQKLERLAARKDRVLQRYNATRQEGDPEMPCIQQDACPCWGREQASASFWMAKSRAPQCRVSNVPPVMQANLTGGSATGSDSANMLAYVNSTQGNNLCSYTDQASGTRTLQYVSETDARVCATQVEAICSVLP